MQNCYHNVIHQLSETLDSLWRMDTYINDARQEENDKEVKFWEEYKKTLEEQIATLKIHLEEGVRKGEFS